MKLLKRNNAIPQALKGGLDLLGVPLAEADYGLIIVPWATRRDDNSITVELRRLASCNATEEGAFVLYGSSIQYTFRHVSFSFQRRFLLDGLGSDSAERLSAVLSASCDRMLKRMMRLNTRKKLSEVTSIDSANVEVTSLFSKYGEKEVVGSARFVYLGMPVDCVLLREPRGAGVKVFLIGRLSRTLLNSLLQDISL